MKTKSAETPGAHLSASGGSFDPATINHLPAAVRDAAFFGIAHAADGVFVWTVPAALAVLVLSVLIRETPLRGRSEGPEEALARQEAELVC